jgi:GT2 family glycosyltransferase
MLKPRASVVIPVHNESIYLYSTVTALLNTSKIPIEIIVVDDESTDSSSSFIGRGIFRDVRLIRHKRMGSSRTRNIGAQHAHSNVLVFLDGHCVPQPDWLERLLLVLEHHESTIVTPCIVDAMDPTSKGFGVTLENRLTDYIWLVDKRTEDPYEVPVACGACMVMRKDVFHQLGGFDSTRTWGGEDVEICIRAWLLGHSVVVVPTVEVRHLFKEKAQFRTPCSDYIYNFLRAAILHFDGERLGRMLDDLETSPAFPEAVRLLRPSDIWERYRFVRDRRIHNGDWLCDRFDIKL